MKKLVVLALVLAGAMVAWQTGRFNDDADVTAPDEPEPLQITFDQLRGIDPARDGPFGMPIAGVPDAVRPLDGQTIVLEGYADPMVVELKAVTKFRMLRTIGACCFGVPHLANEVVLVEMKDPREEIEIRIGDFVRVRGTFRVVAALDDPRRGTLLYRLEADDVVVVSSF